jgi:N,N'-diacetyllegionaminate synthase
MWMNRDQVYIIAEVSGNHGKDYERAKRHIKVAAECGADAVKFQTFTAEELAAPNIRIPTGFDSKHDQWLKQMGATYLHELLALGGLPRAWHRDLARYAQECGIDFMSTPFSVDAARFLVEDIGVKVVKVASGDITFKPLLHYLGTLRAQPIIVSTGASTFGDVAEALELMPKRTPFNTALLHCVSTYPCPFDDANLSAIRTLSEQFQYPTGYSDHTVSTQFVPSMAVALGAQILEKHMTIDEQVTIDSAHSLGPRRFTKYVKSVRMAEKLLGSGVKEPQPSEQHDRIWARRSPCDWLRPTDEARMGNWIDPYIGVKYHDC